MFCPKCGTKLPDGAKFCGSCGAQLSSAPVTPATKPAHAAASAATARAHAAVPAAAGTIDAKMLIVLILGIAALFFAFQPWIPVSQSDYQTSNAISQGANALAGLFGGTGTEGSGLALKPAYAMYEIPQYVQVYQQYGLSGANSVGSGAASMLPVWIGCIAVAAVGLVLFAVRRNRIVAVVGFIALGLLAALFAAVLMDNSSDLTGPLFCCVLSAVTVIAAIAVGGRKRTA